MKCDILNIEWCSHGRDIDIVEPVLSYLEIKYDLKIVRESILDFSSKLIKYQPKMLVIPSAIGASENMDLLRLATKMGIKVVTLVSEGDYVDGEQHINQFFWGWNKEKFFYENLHLEWSERNIEMIHKYIPNSQEYNIKVSGATSFDRYKILPYMTKQELCKKYQKKYDRIIGLAAWGFDKIFDEEYQKKWSNFYNDIGQDTIESHRHSRELLKQILKKIIEENTDILFILKHHPGVLDEALTEFHGLEDYENVLVIRGKDENIADVISASDIWVAYESTTCLEAWLLGKQTMLINPLGGGFKRSEIAEGSPIKETYDDVQSAIEEFYKSGKLAGFEELKEKRKKIITRVIQWDDGKNHIRAGEYIYQEFTKQIHKKRSLDLGSVKTIMKCVVKRVIYHSALRKTALFEKKVADFIHFDNIFSQEERKVEHQKYKRHLREFYDRNGMEIKTKT